MSWTFGFGYFVKIIELHVCFGKSTPLEHFVENNVLERPFLKLETERPVLSSLCLARRVSDGVRFGKSRDSSFDGRSLYAFTWMRVGRTDFSREVDRAKR